MPLWGKWLDPVDLGSTVEIHMKVRILPRAQIHIGVYLLSLIRSRKSKWLHIGSNPISPTKCSDDGTNLIGGVAEWLIAEVLRTSGRAERPVGSNPASSAKWHFSSVG